jgi:hypothetical protein
MGIGLASQNYETVESSDTTTCVKELSGDGKKIGLLKKFLTVGCGL